MAFVMQGIRTAVDELPGTLDPLPAVLAAMYREIAEKHGAPQAAEFLLIARPGQSQVLPLRFPRPDGRLVMTPRLIQSECYTAPLLSSQAAATQPARRMTPSTRTAARWSRRPTPGSVSLYDVVGSTSRVAPRSRSAASRPGPMREAPLDGRRVPLRHGNAHFSSQSRQRRQSHPDRIPFRTVGRRSSSGVGGWRRAREVRRRLGGDFIRCRLPARRQRRHTYGAGTARGLGSARLRASYAHAADRHGCLCVGVATAVRMSAGAS